MSIINAAGVLGLASVLIRPYRSIGPFSADVTISERHVDRLEISQHPVDQGAMMSDHAFLHPPELTIQCGWSNSTLKGLPAALQSVITGNMSGTVQLVYQRLLALQSSRIPFSVYTGKRVYKNMLIAELSTDTEKETENVLVVTARLQTVLIARTRVVTIAAPASAQPLAPSTVSPVSNGAKSLKPSTSYVP